MSGSTYLIINHEFNIIDPFTNNGFDYAYVGTAYDNVVDHYRLVADTSFVTPIFYWVHQAQIPNAWGEGTEWHCIPDSDGDNMDDDYEEEMGLDPNVDDADSDQDGDGVTNYDEYIEDVANGNFDFGTTGVNNWGNIVWSGSLSTASGGNRYCGAGTPYICVSDGVRIGP